MPPFMMLVLAATPGLSLQLSAPETNVLVGEPVKLVLHWRASQAIANLGTEDTEFTRRSIDFFVNDGSGEKRYREMIRGTKNEMEQYATLEAGHEVTVNYVLCDGWYLPAADENPRALLFGSPGRYTLRIGHLSRSRTDILDYSNSVLITVSAPAGSDAALLDLLRRDETLLQGAAPIPRIREIIDANQGSPYVRWLKVTLYARYAKALQNNEDPESGDSWWRLGKEESSRRARTFAEGITQELRLDSDWGPFEEERLWALARWARSAHDLALSAWARDQIKQLFPNSMAAAGVKEWEDALQEAAVLDAETDDTPPPSDGVSPVVLATASPSYLWPANNKLIPIKVTLDVTDDDDPNPTVKLMSITCDPSCAEARDIVGAEYGTDDREFFLRASVSPRVKRSGGGGRHRGQGERSYHITYSAEDDEGHKTSAETVVVVAARPPFSYVRPILNCVADSGPDARVTYFGYENSGPLPVAIPVGWKNSFFPPPKDRSQPTSFLVGRHDKVLKLSFDGRPPLIWRLGAGWRIAGPRRASRGPSNAHPCAMPLARAQEESPGGSFFAADVGWVVAGGEEEQRPPRLARVGESIEEATGTGEPVPVCRCPSAALELKAS